MIQLHKLVLCCALVWGGALCTLPTAAEARPVPRAARASARVVVRGLAKAGRLLLRRHRRHAHYQHAVTCGPCCRP
jgi:hypothetical protein